MKQSELALVINGIAPALGRLLADAVAPIVERISELEEKLATLPAQEAPPLPDIAGMVDGAVAVAIKAIPTPRDGLDVDMEAVGTLIAAEVKSVLEGWEKPADGTSVTLNEVEPLISAEVAKAVEQIKAPADGVGLASAIQSHDGHLILTMTDGRTVDVGPVAGKDVDMDRVSAEVAQAVKAIPAPTDGLDGVGFDDLDLVESEDGLTLRFERGETVKEFPLPVVFDRGVYREDVSYRKGNGVTWGGSYWIAQKDAPGKPDTPDSGWRLAVKKGRDLTK